MDWDRSVGRLSDSIDELRLSRASDHADTPASTSIAAAIKMAYDATLSGEKCDEDFEFPSDQHDQHVKHVLWGRAKR